MYDIPPTPSPSSSASQPDALSRDRATGVGARPKPHPLSRRGLLQGLGAVAAVTTTAPLLAPAQAEAQETPPQRPAMRSPHRLAPLSGASAPPLPPLEIIVFNRMAFGPRSGDVEAFQALGGTPRARLEAYVEQQLDPDSIDNSECDARLAAYGFQTLGKPLAQLWADHIKSEAAKDWKYRRLPVLETERATLLKAVYSKRQLVEVLADFWHNHFNVFGWDNWIQSVFVHYDRDVIRGNMLGNFHRMLQDVAQSPAMLYYLDNQSNSGGNPNENYARELFELHTMGAENYLGVRSPNDPALVDDEGRRIGYIDEDVYGATTCFTGWRVNGNTGLFEFDASKHFPYQKIVLGQVIPSFQGVKDGHDVLDLLATHPGTARFICRKLCRRLIGDHPPERVVEEAAAVFTAGKDAPDQLKRVVRTILLSEEFQTTWGQKIKRPFTYAASILRATGADFMPTDSFMWSYNSMGQGLFQWHPPNGYPDFKDDWSSTMPMLQRWRFCNWLLGWKYGGDGENKDRLRVDLLAQTPPSVTTPNAIVDFWIGRLLARPLTGAERGPIVDFMAYGRNPDYELPADQIVDRLPHMVALILMSPSFQWR